MANLAARGYGEAGLLASSGLGGFGIIGFVIGTLKLFAAVNGLIKVR